MEDVTAGKRVMRQSLFEDDERQAGESNLMSAPALAHASRIMTYALAGAVAALIVALAALAVALLK